MKKWTSWIKKRTRQKSCPTSEHDPLLLQRAHEGDHIVDLLRRQFHRFHLPNALGDFLLQVSVALSLHFLRSQMPQRHLHRLGNRRVAASVGAMAGPAA